MKKRGWTTGEILLKPIFQKRLERMGVGRNNKKGEKRGKQRVGLLKPVNFVAITRTIAKM